ncbi:MAG TPA: DUF4149 domain-containing protein [Terriglobales bacterium]|nr:DUF4149 domain-containing protein [Terriglobales bacterium]
MPAFLRFLMLLALVVWLGGILFFGAVMAPALFSILPKRELAGAVVTRTLGALHCIGLVAGALFLVCSLLYARMGGTSLGWRNWLIVAMLALTLLSQFAVSPKMVALRRDMVEIDAVAPDDARRVEFNQLHRYSTALEQGVLVLGLVVLWGVATLRHPSME